MKIENDIKSKDEIRRNNTREAVKKMNEIKK